MPPITAHDEPVVDRIEDLAQFQEAMVRVVPVDRGALEVPQDFLPGASICSSVHEL